MTTQPESVDDYRLSVLIQQARAQGQHESHVLWGSTVFDLDSSEPDDFDLIDQEH